VKTAVRRVGSAAIGIALIVGVVTPAQYAFAATPDSAITADPNASLGTLSFYDASGNQVTSGSLNSLQYTYAIASAPKDRPVASNQKATVYYALPDHSQTDSQNWFSGQATTSSLYPVTTLGAPAVVTGAGSNTPVNTMKSGDVTIADFLTTGTMDSTAGWQNFVQVRLFDNAIGQPVRATPFYASVIEVDQVAHTWTQVYPAPPATTATSVSAITADPATSPVPHGTSVTLTGTVSAQDASHPEGSVHLFDGTTDLGVVTSFTAATGAISHTFVPADGDHHFKFNFAPSATATYTGSESAVLDYSVTPLPATTTTLAVKIGSTVVTSATKGQAVVLTASVSPVEATGTIQFYNGNTAIGSPVGLSGGVANSSSITLTTVGVNAFKGVFTPTSAHSGSQGTTTVAVYGTTTTTVSFLKGTTAVSSIYAGDTATLKAVVSPAVAGRIQFKIGSTNVGSPVTLAGGVAKYNKQFTTMGKFTVSATYLPASGVYYLTSTGSKVLTVYKKTTTTLSILNSSNVSVTSAKRGQTLKLKAVLSPSTAAGTITFYRGTTRISGAITISKGVAYFTFKAPTTAGTYTYRAYYTPKAGTLYVKSAGSRTLKVT